MEKLQYLRLQTDVGERALTADAQYQTGYACGRSMTAGVLTVLILLVLMTTYS